MSVKREFRAALPKALQMCGLWRRRESNPRAVPAVPRPAENRSNAGITRRTGAILRGVGG